jgi:DNA-binding FadR family transcriptional regulator
MVTETVTKKTKAISVINKVVRRLREHAQATPPGELIGSEDQLVESYQVSRPTLRQAAALVSQEQLLMVRRGVRGGYFSRRPSTKAVAHIAAIYLQTRHATLEEVIKAIEPIKVEMTLLAATNHTPGQMQQWREFQARDNVPGEYRDFLKCEREFSRVLGESCTNNVLTLFMETLYEFCGYLGPEEDVFRDRPERVREYWDRRRSLVSAIIDSDPEMAVTLGRRCSRLVTGWMVEDMSQKSKGRPSPLKMVLEEA